jgi:hypothetical protein
MLEKTAKQFTVTAATEKNREIAKLAEQLLNSPNGLRILEESLRARLYFDDVMYGGGKKQGD